MKSLSGIAMVLMMGLALAACQKDKAAEKKAAPPPEHSRMVEEYRKGVEESRKVVAAKVNGAEIRMNELVEEMNLIAPQFVDTSRQRDPETDEKVKRAALDILIFRELAIQQATRQGIKAEPRAVEEEIRSLRAKLGSEAEYKAYLTRSGLTEERLRRQIERGALLRLIVEKRLGGMVGAEREKKKQEWEKELLKGAKIEVASGEAWEKLNPVY